MDYREEMKQLRDFLNQQSYLYYVLDAPVIPDFRFFSPHYWIDN